MPSLQELRRKQRTITVQWTPEENAAPIPVQVTYDPGRITMASTDIPDDGKTLHDFWEERICDYVRSWDILADDGAMVPITPEGVALLETALVEVILTEIQADARPKPKSMTSI